MKQNKKIILNTFLIIIFSILIGVSLLCLAYSLPLTKIRENVEESVYMLKKDMFFEVIEEQKHTLLDNHTDALMLQHAVYNGPESILEKSLRVYRIDYEGVQISIDSLDKFFSSSNESIKNTYTRYWHGYLIILKPLLMFFDYSEIKIVNMFIQFFLIFYLIYLMIKKNLDKYLIGYIISIVLIYPITIMLCLEFSIIFYIFNIGILIILKYHEKLKNNNLYIYYFLILGIITSYFDFLTYPLATLYMPLIMMFIMEDKSFKEKVIDIIKYSFFWLVGYAFMWISKWLIASIILKENIFIEAINAFNLRTSLILNSENSRIIALGSNLLAFNNKPTYLLFIGLLIALIGKIIKKEYRLDKKKIINNLPLFIISIVPIIWYLLVVNHSYIHAYFTYRLMCITIFSILTYILSVFNRVEPEKTKL